MKRPVAHPVRDSVSFRMCQYLQARGSNQEQTHFSARKSTTQKLPGLPRALCGGGSEPAL